MREIGRELVAWYRAAHRDLPWRRTRDPWRILVAEIMLQQTRVQAVLPYYERFLARFPTPAALAEAPPPEVLAHWAGLGYYGRARNLQKAARRIAEAGAFPSDFDSIRALPGVGDYTAAAVASIAFGLPYPVVDGNVLRVVARITNDPADIAAASTRRRFAAVAGSWLDVSDPETFNQALMELGATVCLPREPNCLLCPVAAHCAARAAGTQEELPVKLRRARAERLEHTLLRIERHGALLMWQQSDPAQRMYGFWELPYREQLPAARPGKLLGEFRHTITHHHYRFRVMTATVREAPAGFRWLTPEERQVLPVSTIARKALGAVRRPGPRERKSRPGAP